jgi:cytochrome c556
MKVLFNVTVAMAILTGSAVSAAENQLPIVKYREAVMKSLAADSGAIGTILKEKLPLTKNLAAHAQSLNAKAAMLGDLFPAGSGDKTESLPAIWKDPEGFKEAIKKFQDATAKLVEVSAAGDEAKFGEQMAAVGKSCGSCHKTFRKKHEH